MNYSIETEENLKGYTEEAKTILNTLSKDYRSKSSDSSHQMEISPANSLNEQDIDNSYPKILLNSSSKFKKKKNILKEQRVSLNSITEINSAISSNFQISENSLIYEKKNPYRKSYVFRKDFSRLAIRTRKKKSMKEDTRFKPVKKKKMGFFENLFFLRANRIFKISKFRKLQMSDIAQLPGTCLASTAMTDFEKIYLKELKTGGKKKSYHLLRAIFKYKKKFLLTSIILRVLSDIIMISIPLFIRAYSKGVKAANTEILKSLIYLISIPFLIFMQDLLRQQSDKNISAVSSHTLQALRGLLFEKLLEADYKFLQISDPSLLSRLIFFEFQHINEFLGAIPALFSSPFVIILSGILVIISLTNLSIWIILCATLIQIFIILFLLNHFNLRIMKGRDKYSNTGSKQAIKLQELIANIDNVKVNSFEVYFQKKMIQLRYEAQKSLKRVHGSYGVIEFILILTPFLFSCVIITAFNFASEGIETSQAILVISMMVAVAVPLRSFSESLRKTRIFQVAYKCASKFFETIIENGKGKCNWDEDGLETGEVSWIDCFFVSDEGLAVKKVQDVFNQAAPKDFKKSKSQEFSNLRAYTLVKSYTMNKCQVLPFDSKESSGHEIGYKKTVLKGVSFGVKRGEKICVIGREGCGKNELFLGILCELNMSSGIFKKKGKIAYLDMNNPKFLKASIRENIVLGEQYFKDKFENILRKVDLNIMKYHGGEMMEIVEGQRNISTEDQKKILLARLLYKDADIYLINKYFDLLSKNQQQPIFEKIVKRYLKEKTVMYTSNVNLLTKLCDRVFVFKGGALVEKGTYDQLIAQRKSHMYEVIMTDNTGSTNFFGKILEGLRIYPKGAEVEKMYDDERKLTAFENLKKIKKLTRNMVIFNSPNKDKSKLVVKKLKNWAVEFSERERGKILQEEESVSLDNAKFALKQIFRARGFKRFLVVCLFFLITDISLVALQLWLAIWSLNYFNLSYNSNFYIYIGMFFFSSLCVISREFAYTNLTVKNLTYLYINSIKSLLKAREDYFDQNPSSRVVYLLTKDQMTVDNELVRSLFTVIDACLIIIIILLTLNYIYLGLMLVITIALFILFYRLYNKFVTVAKRLLAFSAKSRAEMIDVYLNTFDNLPMLRGMGKSDYFRKKFYEKTNEYQMASTNLNNHSMRWLNLRISLFSIVCIITILGLPLLSKLFFKHYLDQSWKLNYSANTGPFLLAAIINFSKFLPKATLQMVSSQRIFHYIFRMAKESPERLKVKEKNLSQKIPEPLGKLIQRVGHLKKSMTESPIKKKELKRCESSKPKLLSKSIPMNLNFGRSGNESESPIPRKSKNSIFGNFSPYVPRHLWKKTKTNFVKRSAKKTAMKGTVIQTFMQNFQTKHVLKEKNKTVSQLRTKPLILVQNVNFSNKKYRILKNVSLKVYRAERVGIIAEGENSGRHSLLQLLLLNKSYDEEKFNMDLKRSVIELLENDTKLTNKQKLRKDMIFLSQRPCLFYGTVHENIDPYNEYKEEEIIRTFHFLKGFIALENFTGQTGAKEIMVTLKKKEGLLELREIDYDEVLLGDEEFNNDPNNQFHRTFTNNIKSNSVGKKKNSQFGNRLGIHRKRQSFRGSLNMRKLRRRKSHVMNHSKREIELIKKNLATSGWGKQKTNAIEEFFQEQINDEIPKSERAKRIDEGLQDFDTNYELHSVMYKDEFDVVKEFLKMQVGQNGKNLNEALKKICQLTRVFLHKPKLIFMDENALSIPGIGSKFFIEQLFSVMKDSAILSITKNYTQLYHYTRVYVLREGLMVEEGNPLDLVDNKNSKLYKILARDDIRTVRQLENKLEKNIRKFEEDQEAAVKYIQELMKEEIAREEAERQKLIEMGIDPFAQEEEEEEKVEVKEEVGKSKFATAKPSRFKIFVDEEG